MGGNSSHETYESSNAHKDGYHYWAKFETEPFSEGVSRYAFKGKYKGSGPLNGDACVTKVFKKEYAKNFDMWVPDLASSKKAQMFAENFNTRQLYKLDINAKRELDFVIPLIAKTDKLSRFELLWFVPLGSEDKRYVMPQEYVAIEPYISGNYEKFNSNGGYEDQNLSTLLPAFTHWTWEISGHKYMVCDLQGVKCPDEYKLTDPVVHSVDMIFGKTDLGVVGMERVLANHNCNLICQQLGLQNPMTSVYMPVLARSTTYSFQLTEEQMLRNKRGVSRHFQVMPAILE